MKIGIIFTGQPRTILQTYENIKNSIMDNKHEYKIYYFTWKSEDITIFKSVFPQADIYQIEPPTINNELFTTWINADIKRWVPEEDGTNMLLFTYFLQLYIRNYAGETINSINKNMCFDLLLHLRPDIVFSKEITQYYNNINNDTIYITENPQYYTFPSLLSMNDFMCLGKPIEIINTLQLLNYIPNLSIKDNIKDLFSKTWNNFVHPETSLYIYISVLLYYKVILIDNLKLTIIR